MIGKFMQYVLWGMAMIKFKNLKTGEIKTAFSLREDGEKAYTKFSSDGKEYGYFKSNN